MSRYSKLLTKIIAESGYTAKEIVEKCNELGNGIDTTRLSKLQSGKLSAPSSKVSRDLAHVCNVDERLLVLEGYIEKAPQEIIDAFMSIKMSIVAVSLNIFKNNFSNVTTKDLKLIREELEKEPLADFIISLIDDGVENISVNKNAIDLQAIEKDENKNITMTLSQPTTLPVKDNGMYPTIPGGSKVYLEIQEKYNTGDILAIKAKDIENPIIRQVVFSNNVVILMPIKKDFKTLIYKKDDLIFLGRVTEVLTKI